jgi:hypothetical protein
VIDPTSIRMPGFFCRILEFIPEDSSHLVLTVSPIVLEIGEVGSSFCYEAVYLLVETCPSIALIFTEMV